MGRLPPGLSRQVNGIYKYRRRVPDRLKGKTIDGVAFPAREWLRSYGTRNPAEARRLHHEHDANITAMIDRAELSLLEESNPAEASQQREQRLADEANARAKAQRYAGREEARIALRQRLMLSTAELTPEEAAAVDLIREGQGGPQSSFQAARLTLEAGAERIAGKTVKEAVRLYTERVVETKAKSTRKSNGTAFAFLETALGADARLNQIDRDKARRALKLLHMQPRDQWAGRGMTPHRRAALADGGKLPLLSSKAIKDSYLSFWSALFSYACREGWTDRNPFEGLGREVKGRETEKRNPFSEAELAVLFSSAPWRSGESAPSGKAIRYWGPLLALYHGLRRGEIASLRADSFRLEKGIVIFEIDGTKTDNAPRRHALHPQLIRLGLFALAQSRAGKGMLFEGEAMDAREIWGDAFGDWFARHRKGLGIGVRGQGLHSLRHSWEDALREADLHQSAIGQYLGGRTALDPVGADYGRGYSAAKLFEAISKVHYPGLELPLPS